MKKVLSIFIFTLLSFLSYAQPAFRHVYGSDYSLLPETSISEEYKNRLKNLFEVNYCFQSVMSIPATKAKGYTCAQMLKKLDQMGGLDKECYGVSYINADGERKAMFKKAELSRNGHELYIKDKAAGGLNFDFRVEEKAFGEGQKLYAVTAVLNKNPANILLRELKKDEAAIFVLMKEDSEKIELYVLIQCTYSPMKYRLLKRIVENAVMSRVLEVQNWFYRMLCQEK